MADCFTQEPACNTQNLYTTWGYLRGVITTDYRDWAESRNEPHMPSAFATRQGTRLLSLAVALATVCERLYRARTPRTPLPHTRRRTQRAALARRARLDACVRRRVDCVRAGGVAVMMRVNDARLTRAYTHTRVNRLVSVLEIRTCNPSITRRWSSRARLISEHPAPMRFGPDRMTTTRCFLLFFLSLTLPL